MRFKRIFLIVIDSVGIGAMPDAAAYGDEGANTLGHIAEVSGGIELPTMAQLGLGHLGPFKGVPILNDVKGFYTKMAEKSVGKDTMTGHWELMGLYVDRPFKTFTDTGFPKSLLDAISKKTGRGIVGNIAASGTEIIEQYGEHHLETGDWIVYTSADSVLQIAAHEEKVGLAALYDACAYARKLTLADEYKLGRVIARPFVGTGKGAFSRTSNRRDYALKPFEKTVLDHLSAGGFDVHAFGKIRDIFDGEGITWSKKQPDNDAGMQHFTAHVKVDFTGLAFLNLVDFDALYGHRRDPAGYKKALETFDVQLSSLCAALKDDDLLMITADHGNDPTHHGTDHTREYVPLLVYGKQLSGGPLPMRQSFADVGATIADNFGVTAPVHGLTFLDLLR
ncbi:MAG: phosphopentomutase [Acholeplasmatales bacterium]|nr:MAG: phosphopentomutase [Acholeplasmatales bacterium]